MTQNQINTELLLKERGNGSGLIPQIIQTQGQDDYINWQPTDKEMQDLANLLQRAKVGETLGREGDLGNAANGDDSKDAVASGDSQNGGTAGDSTNNATGGENPEGESHKRGWPGIYWDQFYSILKELEVLYPTFPDGTTFPVIKSAILNSFTSLPTGTTIAIPLTVGQQVWVMEDNKPHQMEVLAIETRVGTQSQTTVLVLHHKMEGVRVSKSFSKVFPTKEALLASL